MEDMPKIEFRVSEEEMAIIREAANENPAGISGYVRSAALSKAKDENTIQDYINLFRKAIQEEADTFREIFGANPAGSNKMSVSPRNLPGTGPYNPYEGWWVEPAPNGSTKGYYSDEYGCSVKVITNGKQRVVLRDDNPLYGSL